MAADFYMTSTECFDLEEPRACSIIRRLPAETGGDFLLVQIDPPVDASDLYGPDTTRLDKVVLTPRHVGATLCPVNEWPMHVHVLHVKDPDRLEQIEPGSFDRYAWAELHPSRRAAQRARPRSK
jgi:hypothetical protein